MPHDAHESQDARESLTAGPGSSHVMGASDETLMHRATAGDEASFAELVARYEAPLRRVARNRLGRDDWVDDAVQETFLAVHKGGHTYDSRYRFRTWLWTILLNVCRQLWQRHARTPATTSCWDQPPAQLDEAARPSGARPQSDTPLDQLLQKERALLLARLLDRLTPAQADALRLRFFAGLKFQELADAMGCSLPTAKNRVRWGLLRLSQLIEADRAAWTVDGEPAAGRENPAKPPADLDPTSIRSSRGEPR